ncbi:hypothetical protein EOD41_16520 [Mucilaginibacter limnophilus]|uniref:Lipoprotein n=1 Tax=Mucilaginibacter limnophilus TaxID=1932778 RepID=A0A437ML53_9SPHI|nr:hypothetical protein [Mucilaginibacter limnophilus]RVT98397.1 hypothetical protein EOD41_16520 [Mucilaginibacter limnophilus]
MKKILLPLLLFVAVFVGCKIPQVVVGMTEQQFTKEHQYAQMVETSEYRTVYKEPYYEKYRYYYFREGKLYLMDEGHTVRGTKEQEPSR